MEVIWKWKSPFEGNTTAWMVVSEDKKGAIVGVYRVLNLVNKPFSRVALKGLDENFCYEIEGMDGKFYGDELMQIGISTSEKTYQGQMENSGDFKSEIFILHGEK